MSARVLRCSVMRCVYNTPLKHNRACQEALVFVQTVIKRFALSLSFSLSAVSQFFFLSQRGNLSLSFSLSCSQFSLFLSLSFWWKVPCALGVMGSRHATCSCVTTWERAEWRSEEIMRTSVLSNAASCCSQIKDQLYCSPHWSTLHTAAAAAVQGPHTHSLTRSLIYDCLSNIHSLPFTHTCIHSPIHLLTDSSIY